MEVFFKVIAAVIITVMLSLAISSQSKIFAVILTVSASCMVLSAAMQYLQPVISLMKSLNALGDLEPELFRTLLKAVGIGLLSEIVMLVCADSGNATLGKSIQLLSTIMILFLSVPLFTKLLEIIQQILTN